MSHRKIILGIDTSTKALVIVVGSYEIAAPPSGARNDTNSSLRGAQATKQSHNNEPLYTVLASFFQVIERKHMEYCISVVEQLIKDASTKITDLDAVAVGLGPGSLIGCRVGLITAKTLAQVLNLPLIGISTVDVINARSIEVEGTLYPAPEGIIIKAVEKLQKQQFDSIFDLEPIYLRGPV